MRRTLLLGLALLFAMGSLPSARAADKSIEMRDSYFATRYIVITTGDSITWTNAGSAKHTVTTQPGAPEAFDSSPNSDPQASGTHCGGTVLNDDDCIDPGKTFSFTFDKIGTYNYYCKAHGQADTRPDPSLGAQSQPCGMCAQVVVQAKSTPAPPKRRPPSTRPRTSASSSASASASPSPSPSGSVFPNANGSPLAAGKGDGGGGGGGGGRTTLAVLAILGLSGAGYATWRKFLAPR